MKNLILIGGAMGVGKTTTGQILKRKLLNAVYLDGDWCWDADPFVVTDETKKMVIENITALLNNFLACSAYENVIFTWVMHEQAIIDDLLSRIKATNVRVFSFSLVSDRAHLINRLMSDVQAGIRKMDVIERSVLRLPLYEKLDTVKIDTTDRNAEETANEIIRKIFV
ncbi:MAG: AAA family ATPase [Clostridia bacterium]|nr:AAA family ATPase [Clostridia bacterium]